MCDHTEIILKCQLLSALYDSAPECAIDCARDENVVFMQEIDMNREIQDQSKIRMKNNREKTRDKKKSTTSIELYTERARMVSPTINPTYIVFISIREQ